MPREKELLDNKKKKENKNKDKEKQKEAVAKKYGISLADIEHVELDNGKEFFKFYNPKDRSVKMIENIDYDHGLSTQFKNIQQELSYTQGSNERDNAEAIYEHTSEHKNIELNLIPIVELKSNRFKYMRMINSLSTIDRKKVKALIKSSKELKLRYINIENAIGIDEQNSVIDVKFDYMNNRAVIRNAKVLNYQDHKEYADNTEEVLEISEEEFNQIANGITISDDVPVVTEADERIIVHGEEISINTAIQIYDYPETIDKMNLSTKQKGIYHGIVAALKRRLNIKNNSKKNQKVKVLKNKDDHRTAA